MIDVVVDDTTCWLDTIVRGEDIRLPTNSRSVCEVQRSAFLTYVRNTLIFPRGRSRVTWGRYTFLSVSWQTFDDTAELLRKRRAGSNFPLAEQRQIV